jgi:hypothetical protein
MSLSALLDARDGLGTSVGSTPRSPSVSANPNLPDPMNAQMAPRPSVRRPSVSERRRSTLRLLALQLTITLLGVLLLTTSLLA